MFRPPGRFANAQALVAKSARRSSLIFTSLLRRSWLTVRVHVDAFCLEPRDYAQAVFWRACGLKLRSRNRLAALMGRSLSAYSLWIERTEPGLHAEFLEDGLALSGSIITVVDAVACDENARDTIESIVQAGGCPVIVGNGGKSGIRHVRRPAELAQLLSPSGSWLCILGPGDRLASKALQIYDKFAGAAGVAKIIYSDDDLVEDGRRHSPHFKSSWNPDLFVHHDFITGSAIVRVTPDMVAGLRGENWAEQLTRLLIGQEAAPTHLPAVLHHRRRRPAPVVPEKAGASVLRDRVPSVAVIIPTRNSLSYLRNCIDGVRGSDYPAVELIVVDNGSDDPATLDYLELLEGEGVRILRVAGDFNFSALNNIAARHARADFLCFLNNDVEIVDPDWLSMLVRQALRPELGAVGCRLLYPDGTVQHAGVVIGVGGGAAHAHKNVGASDEGYFLRDKLPQRVSAVTAACLVLSKEKFLAVGGFNEVDFPVAFNDVDLCLRLNARGWQSFYEPRAVLVHHESKSRGSDSSKRNRLRFAGELAALKRHWATDRRRDPYHHPHLSPFCEQFTISV